MIEVSVIIVNYNTKYLLRECLESIYRHTAHVSFEIIVVDNASKDGSQRYITTLHPHLKWINSPTNIGFGRANNLGAEHAEGQYLFLLNSDTLLLNNAIKHLHDYMQSHAHEPLGAIGAWLTDAQGSPNSSYGDFPTPRSELRYIASTLRPHPKPHAPTEMDVDYICGADIFMRRELFARLSGFDPHIFMYYEETELQWRMAKMGYIRRLIPTPQIIHLEGGSFTNRGLSYSRFMMSQRSFNYYIDKCYSGVKWIVFRAVVIVVRLSIFRQRWSLAERLRAYWLVIEGSCEVR